MRYIRAFAHWFLDGFMTHDPYWYGQTTKEN
jgi:hypothetical protein